MSRKFFVFLLVFCVFIGAYAVGADTVRYTHEASGLSFTLPDGWSQMETKAEWEYIDAGFSCDADPLALIYFGTSDIWAQTDPADKIGYQRSDINAEMFNAADFADIYGVDLDAVKPETYNNMQYYKILQTATKSVNGVDITVTSTTMSCIDNGWMYQFQFSGTEESPYYADFQALLNTVSYPSSQTTTSTAYTTAPAPFSTDTPYSQTTESKDSLSWSFADILLSLVITITVYTIPVLVYRFGIRKTPMEPHAAKRFTIVYAVIGFVIMCILVALVNGGAASGGGLLLWSFINYKILTKGNLQS